MLTKSTNFEIKDGPTGVILVYTVCRCLRTHAAARLSLRLQMDDSSKIRVKPGKLFNQKNKQAEGVGQRHMQLYAYYELGLAMLHIHWSNDSQALNIRNRMPAREVPFTCPQFALLCLSPSGVQSVKRNRVLSPHQLHQWEAEPKPDLNAKCISWAPGYSAVRLGDLSRTMQTCVLTSAADDWT